MPQSWSSIRKRLEQDLLCEKLKGRVQYFRTNYHGAPDEYGRFAIRIDGKEVFQANPYNENRYDAIAFSMKRELNIPHREPNGRGEFLFDKENREVEDMARLQSINEGVVDSCEVPHMIKKYLGQDIKASISDENPVIRLLAILDRRVGRRTLQSIKTTLDEQPEWLREFYKLRLEGEGMI